MRDQKNPETNQNIHGPKPIECFKELIDQFNNVKAKYQFWLTFNKEQDQMKMDWPR